VAAAEAELKYSLGRWIKLLVKSDVTVSSGKSVYFDLFAKNDAAVAVIADQSGRSGRVNG
jgi:hypothetical protein